MRGSEIQGRLQALAELHRRVATHLGQSAEGIKQMKKEIEGTAAIVSHVQGHPGAGTLTIDTANIIEDDSAGSPARSGRHIRLRVTDTGIESESGPDGRYILEDVPAGFAVNAIITSSGSRPANSVTSGRTIAWNASSFVRACSAVSACGWEPAD